MEARFQPHPKVDGLGRERRNLRLASAEVREAKDDGSIPFIGHAAVFNSPALIEGWFEDWREQVLPGAFRKTISEADIRMLINHNPDMPLARNRAGTLRLEEDDVGLRTEADMAPTSYGRDIAISLERRDVSQMSIAFNVVKEEWDWEAEPPLRSIQEVKLSDVSIVTYPAFVETDAALRSAALTNLMELAHLNSEARSRLLRGLAGGTISGEIREALRAAGEALGGLARSGEPAASHSLEALKAQHMAIATMYGLEECA